MPIEFTALPTEDVRRIRQTGRDAYGDPVETHRAAGDGVRLCRHCLEHVPAGKEYLILAHRPFRSTQPYAETGPIFLCAEDCARAAPSPEVPPILQAETYLVKGYDADERIIYGTGQITPTPEIAGYAETLLDDPNVAFVDIRSASNNCFSCRVHRA